MIASFFRALIDDLRKSMSDTAFNTALHESDRRNLPGVRAQGLSGQNTA
jgi:hypothetical protein